MGTRGGAGLSKNARSGRVPTEGPGEGTREHAGSPSLDPTASAPVIASVRGAVIARGGDHVVVEVRGVGYKVFVPRHPASDDDAHAALVALGYTAAEASAALRGVPAKGRASTEERLSAALRASGRTLVAEG